MSTREHVYLRITSAAVTVILCDAHSSMARVIASLEVPKGKQGADDMTELCSVIEKVLSKVERSVESVTAILSDELIYAFAEPVSKAKTGEQSARSRIARMIPAPIEELVWSEMPIILAEPSQNLSEPFVTFSVMRRALAEGITSVVHEKTKAHTTLFVSATTALWNTIATQPKSAACVLSEDGDSIDLGFFASGTAHPLMTLSISTPTKRDGQKSERANLLTRAVAYAREHYHLPVQHIIYNDGSDSVPSLKTIAAELQCEIIKWQPQTASSSTTIDADPKSDVWLAVCASLSSIDVEDIPHVTTHSEKLHLGDMHEMSTAVTATAHSAVEWVNEHSAHISTSSQRNRAKKLSVIVAFVGALGLLLWTIATYI